MAKAPVPKGDPKTFIFTRSIKQHGSDAATMFRMECTVTGVDATHIHFRPNKVVEVQGDMPQPDNLLEPSSISRKAFDVMERNGGILSVAR